MTRLGQKLIKSAREARPILARDQMLPVLVCGSANYDDREAVFRELDALAVDNTLCIIQLDGRGAAYLARKWAYDSPHGVALITVIHHKWQRYSQIFATTAPHLVLVFAADRSTAQLVAAAKRAKIKVRYCE